MTDAHEVAMPQRIIQWIEADGGDHALLLVTLDASSRPHLMMLARDEIAVVSPARLQVAIGETSRSGTNLGLRSFATLAIYDAGLACILKTRAVAGPHPLLAGTMAYELVVEDVHFDRPSTAEGSARLVTGLRFEGRAERRDVREKLKTSKRQA